MARVETYDVLGVKVSVLNPDKAEHVIKGMIAHREKGYVCVAPVSMIMDCQADPAYLDIVNKADLVTPDGAPVAWLGQINGHKDVARTYGPGLMEQLCDHGRVLQWKHFFYGATPDVCDRLERSLKQRFPGLNVVGKLSPPFLPQAARLTDEVAVLINAAKPDIIWVGLGAPKQDFWNVLNRSVLDAPVLIGIGAAFDFLSGVKPQAPRWMQTVGLEWLFRLGCEPRRLWRRYLIGNTLFVWLLVKSCFRGK
ncbi:MAG: WecB/TagA/CpsF family glycosyltransferase [Candidatus Omnitrophica bacterium]|nr:WecB/TagA/CpsF family glycosyltransferase [Candidatus Omnitrophota bacterium]